MSDIKFAKYLENKHGVTKDGHVMFDRDIVQGLNRKSHLEALTVNQQERIAELEAFVDRFVEASDGLTTISADEAIELQRGSNDNIN